MNDENCLFTVKWKWYNQGMSVQRDFLFVGGSKDGEWMPLPDTRSVWRVPIVEKQSIAEPALTTGIRYEQYYLERLRATHDYLIYRHESLTIDNVIMRLLKHYKSELSE
ncbi:MAG: hypothetical protein QOH63_1975 [Acidobacteriota bacterium]|jgi:hypothetical protein|nr:hypothetical protein [Acidobacteriota bacterium]